MNIIIKRISTTLAVLLVVNCALYSPRAQQRTQWVGVVVERDVARAIWDRGTGESTTTFTAIKTALQNRRLLEVVLKANEKRCRDTCGTGPIDECTRRFVTLALEESVAAEWLTVLEGESKPLSQEAGAAIELAFCRAGFGDTRGCGRPSN